MKNSIKIFSLFILLLSPMFSLANDDDSFFGNGNSISDHFYSDSDDSEFRLFGSSISDPDPNDDFGLPSSPSATDDPPAPIDDYIPLLLVIGLVIGYLYRKKIIFNN